jgi:N-acetylglutamate synthase-like GNAT family acetyltransferase
MSMSSPLLRRASLKDSEFSYHAKRSAFREQVERVWGWNEEEQRRLHEQRFMTQDFRVIEVSGTAVGVMALSAASDCLRLNQLFLLPEHQGHGIGRRCVRLVAEEAGRLGLPVRLRVLKVNTRAQAFFQQLGFLRTGESETHTVMEAPCQRTATAQATGTESARQI